jgi:hypothetical protein
VLLRSSTHNKQPVSQIVVPEVLVSPLLQALHSSADGAHQGASKLLH